MAPSTIRKAIGAVKDQTSISLAKVAGNVAPDLEVLIVKATSHDDEPADEKYVREILHLMSYSRGYVNACVYAISKRLSKTHDWIVALKALMLVHRLLNDGDLLFGQEITYASRKGTRVLNMSDFRDEAHSSSWDHTGFVRTYALYLDQKLEFMVFERKLNGGGEEKRRNNDDGYGSGSGMQRRSQSYDDFNRDSQWQGEKESTKGVTPVREMKSERILELLTQSLLLLDRFLACKPTGGAKNSRMVLVAMYLMVKESFRLYADICEMLALVLDRFPEMEYTDCLKAFDGYVGAAKKIDELVGVYNWSKDIGVARSSEFPEVQRITDKLLETLEGFLRDRANQPIMLEKSKEEIPSSSAVQEEEPNMNEIKALPAPENYTPSPAPVQTQAPPQPKPQTQHVTEDLVNLREDAVSADEQGNKFALALFSGTPSVNNDGSWEAFPSDGDAGITSAWQTPAAETGAANWELALAESASHLSKQKADLAGGFDSLLLNGMYDQGTVRQHVSTTQMSGGSASSVALPSMGGKNATPVLALPAPDGTVIPVGHQDPFAASQFVPPPSYVQIADMEKKQQLLMQEQQIWQQYANNGMQGQMGLTKITSGGAGGYYGGGVQPPYMGQPGGYYYATL